MKENDRNSVYQNDVIKELEEMKELDDQSKREILFVYGGISPVKSLSSAYFTTPDESFLTRLYDIFSRLGIEHTIYKDELGQNFVHYSKNRNYLSRMRKALDENDDYNIGLLYGYPECCVKDYVIKNSSYNESDEFAVRDGRTGFAMRYRPCINCLGNSDSPSYRLHEQIERTIHNFSPRLYPSLRRPRRFTQEQK